MNLEKVMNERKSIRGFTDQPVSKVLLEDVIALANRAPSSMNTQPWHLHVLTGKPLEAVRHGNTERMLAGMTPVREIEDYAAYEGEHRKRQIEIAVQLFEVTCAPKTPPNLCRVRRTKGRTNEGTIYRRTDHRDDQRAGIW